MYCKMITKIRLVNVFITSHNYSLCVCVVRTFKICSLSNLQDYNTKLLTPLGLLRTEKADKPFTVDEDTVFLISI